MRNDGPISVYDHLLGGNLAAFFGIDQQEHRRTDRVLASDLRERPHEVAENLLRDLFDVLVGMNFTPFH